jgi:hypothetical protein
MNSGSARGLSVFAATRRSPANLAAFRLGAVLGNFERAALRRERQLRRWQSASASARWARDTLATSGEGQRQSGEAGSESRPRFPDARHFSPLPNVQRHQ